MRSQTREGEVWRGNIKYDAIVVGSGPAGSWAAKELTEGGLTVLLLEAGPPVIPALDFPLPAPEDQRILCRVKGILAGQSVQIRSYGFTAKSRRFFVNDREHPYLTFPGHRFNWFRGRQVGGRTHVWGRYALRFSAADFKPASQDGYGVDWPIDYDDLAPYYDKVEVFHGLNGSPGGIATLPDGIYAKPHPLNQGELRFKLAVERQYPDCHVISARVLSHNLQRIPTPILAALETGRLVLKTNTIVERVLTDPVNGQATGVTVVDRVTGARQEFHGGLVMLCASTIETLRIMLNSAGGKHPSGLGNSSGLLGRYLMDHLMVIASGPYDKVEQMPVGDATPDLYDYGKNHGFYIPRFVNWGKRETGFLRGYAIQGAIGRDKPHWHMMTQGEMLPRAENQISLDSRRDRWGVPLPLIRMGFGDNEQAMILHAKESLNGLVRAGGLYKDSVPYASLLERAIFAVWKKNLFLPSGASVPGTSSHEAGGARMGENPGNSVLNAYNQCWDTNNVYVTDGACFPSIGSQNITLTIMALTARACAHALRVRRF